ncbi:MAG: mechanosensitive ion channel family protein [Planctomycetota bacterium]|jgi:MscS family membrane protein
MGIRLGLSLLFLTAPLWAQENPRELWTTMRTQRNRPAEETEESLVEAARLFDLADVKSAEDRKEIGRTAAVALFQYLDLVEWPSRRRIPTALTEETWTYKKILAIKREDGLWRISAATRRELPDLLQEELEGSDGEVVYADPRSWFRDLFPESFRGELLMLRGWQWIGLTTLILLGVLLSVVVQFIALQIARRVAVSRGVRLEGGRKVLRPFGLIATGIVWYAGLRYLLLQETAYNILTNAARFVLMVGVVWSFCRVIDWVAEVFSGMATRTHSKLDDILVPMVRKAVKVVVVLLGVVWIAENMGQDIGALLAGLGIGGLAIALASRDTVENFFGALTIITDRPFEVGDWIKMGDIEGTVAHIGFRSTRVRTFYDSVTTFPNSMLIRSAVDNLGSRHYRRLKFELGVAYDTPADKLETFIEGIRELIRLHSLNILCYLFLRTPEWATELRERQRMLMDILRLADGLGVEFAFPTQTLHVMQGEAAAHAAPADDLADAWKRGQAEAKRIVEEFTGDRVPPPVKIGQRPDESLDDGGE